jgi:cytochrome c556
MLKPRSGLVAALMSAVGSIAVPADPMGHIPKRYAKVRVSNPAGTKLARKAAKGNLTGNYRTIACQGIMRQLAARRGSSPLV